MQRAFAAHMAARMRWLCCWGMMLAASLFFPEQAPAAGMADITAISLIEGARLEVARRPLYRSAYYKGGYPPEHEGVCTDLIWRAFKHAGVDMKALLDADIRRFPARYPRAGKKPDSNIDFRRVPNQTALLKQYWKSLNTQVANTGVENEARWLPGDIVVFTNPDHIAVLSDKRNALGIPLLLHNQGPWATEGDDFMYWHQRGFVAHFRLPVRH